MIDLPEPNKPILFRTIYGSFIGKLIQSNQFYFFVCDEIKENKHWITFTRNEIFEWNYL